MNLYFDAHTHLNDDKLYSHREKHIQDFILVGGQGLINVGINNERNLRALHIAKQRKQNSHVNCSIFAALGIHPTETIFGNIHTQKDIDNELNQLQSLYLKNKEYVVALGECGNDAHHGRYENVRKIQRDLFRAQCSLAHAFNLPLVIHSRDSFQDTFDILQGYTDLKIYFHCRGYGKHEIMKCIECFPYLWVGFDGNISYPKAHKIRESFAQIRNIRHGLGSKHKPHILLETDAPYLTPQNKRGSINAPQNIKDIYMYISQTFHIPLHILQEDIASSFEEFIQR